MEILAFRAKLFLHAYSEFNYMSATLAITLVHKLSYGAKMVMVYVASPAYKKHTK